MYGITGGTGASRLVTINLATGAATAIGTTGFQAGSLRFGPGGNLYGGGTGTAAGEIFRIDPATGASTLVGMTGIGTSGLNGVTGLALVSMVTPAGVYRLTLGPRQIVTGLDFGNFFVGDEGDGDSSSVTGSGTQPSQAPSGSSSTVAGDGGGAQPGSGDLTAGYFAAVVAGPPSSTTLATLGGAGLILAPPQAFPTSAAASGDLVDRAIADENVFGLADDALLDGLAIPTWSRLRRWAGSKSTSILT
jgi:hypothetical protein